MKIAHIVCSYPPYYSGMGNVVFQTASELTKLGHEVEVFTPGFYASKEVKKKIEEPEFIHEENVETQQDYARRLKPSFQYGNAARLPSLAQELNNFDIVHLHYPFFGTANIVRRWKIKHPNKKLVITYHMDARSNGWKGLIFQLYAKFWMPKILNAADIIIGSSEDYVLASDAGWHYQQHPNRWNFLPFGVDINRFSPGDKSQVIFDEQNLDITLPTLLFVGGMDKAHYFKGVPVLLRSLLILKDQGIELQAMFVGDGELRDTFELQAKAFDLSKLVRFVGRVSDDELPDYYRAADLLILPSMTKGEAFGMVLLEAMASGVPVIASDLPGVRTVAQDGGLTFLPNDHQSLAQEIAGFFSKDSQRSQWKEQVRKTAEHTYCWPRIVSILEQYYLSLTNNTK